MKYPSIGYANKIATVLRQNSKCGTRLDDFDILEALNDAQNMGRQLGGYAAKNKIILNYSFSIPCQQTSS